MFIKHNEHRPHINQEKVHKHEVLRVLNRICEDETFWRDILENGSDVLYDYDLSVDDKAAIVSGDLSWIENHYGKLQDGQKKFLKSRLEMEKW